AGLRRRFAGLHVPFREDPEPGLLLRRDEQDRQIATTAAKGDTTRLENGVRHAIAAAGAAARSWTPPASPCALRPVADIPRRPGRPCRATPGACRPRC